MLQVRSLVSDSSCVHVFYVPEYLHFGWNKLWTPAHSICVREGTFHTNSIFKLNVTRILWTDDVISMRKDKELVTNMNFIFVWIPKSVGLLKAFFCTNLPSFFPFCRQTLFLLHLLRLQQCHKATPKSIVFKIDLAQFWVIGNHTKEQLHAEYCALILCLKQCKQAGRRQETGCISKFKLRISHRTAYRCNHWHCGKAQVTQVPPGIWPGSCLFACVSTAQMSKFR